MHVLFLEVGAALEEDPAGEKAQMLAAHWMTLARRNSGGSAEVQAGSIKAWADHQNWPDTVRQQITRYNLDAISSFIGRALAAHRKKYYSEQAWMRESERSPEEREQLATAWHALFLEVGAALEEDPTAEHAQALVTRWLELTEMSTQGDPEVKEGAINAWRNRQQWPDFVQQQMTVLNLEKVAEFLDKAYKHRAPKNNL